MPATFVEVEIRVDPSAFDELAGLLAAFGFAGFLEEEASLKCYLPSTDWTPARQQDTRATVEAVARSHGLPSPDLAVRVLEDRDWNREWEATVQPIRVSHRLIIRPSWRAYDAAPGETVLVIDPKMAFGTGYHESTRLVLRLLEEVIRPGMSALDIGTGTGVLAIAAVKLGAAAGVAVDTDEWAFRCARENTALNGVSDRIDVVQGEIASVSPGPFDLITVNIQRNIIERLLPDIRKRLAPAGTLLLSGLLASDSKVIRSALASRHLLVQKEISENEWIAIAASPGWIR